MAGNYGSRRPGITSLLARFGGNLQEQNVEMCTIELFDDIIEWTNKMINRCFKTQSKARDKEMAMMIIAEALIHSGQVAEATEILLRNNRFWINDFYSSDGIQYRSPNMSFVCGLALAALCLYALHCLGAFDKIGQWKKNRRENKH